MKKVATILINEIQFKIELMLTNKTFIATNKLIWPILYFDKRKIKTTNSVYLSKTFFSSYITYSGS